MTHGGFLKFISFLKKDYQVFGPQEKSGQIFIKKVVVPQKVILSQEPPFYSFKKFFVLENEYLFKYKNNELKIFPERKEFKKIALLGMNILDLKAVLLYDLVFADDPYYQKRRGDILIVGHNFTPEKEENLFEEKYDENILKHLPFDIFLAWQDSQAEIFTGSKKGQKVLGDFGCKDYTHIQFSGPIQGNTESRMNILRDKLKNHHHPEIWEKLGQICLECGKCNVVCPTCFCFRLDDEAELEENSGARQRCWDSCFYQEFSEVAGGATLEWW